VTFTGTGKSFGAVRALSEVNLSFHRGECLGLIGHNGAGKSTLMQVLAGTLSADCGVLHWPGMKCAAVTTCRWPASTAFVACFRNCLCART
jgi:ABC-type sugar transport system ATPase subunit